MAIDIGLDGKTIQVYIIIVQLEMLFAQSTIHDHFGAEGGIAHQVCQDRTANGIDDGAEPLACRDLLDACGDNVPFERKIDHYLCPKFAEVQGGEAFSPGRSPGDLCVPPAA